MTEPISWAALLTLMVHPADPEPTIRGQLQYRDSGEPQYAAFSHSGDEEPVFAGHRAEDADFAAPVRVWRDGERIRIEESSGAPSLIANDERCWSFGEGPVPIEGSRRTLHFAFHGTELLQRRRPEDFIGNDFTQPTGPISATTFLDRPAWTVELAPPSHKPHPLQLVVDAETGIVLQQRNDGFGSIAEWTEFVVGEAFDDGLFQWSGETRSSRDVRAERMREHEADMAQRRDWFAANVTPDPLLVEFELIPMVHVHEADGSFQASIGSEGMLARRPRSDDEWDVQWSETGYRWSDEQWDWAFTMHDFGHEQQRPTAAGLARLLAQFGYEPPA